mgnify:CR=1 FL=1
MKKIFYYFLPVAAMLLPTACTTEEDFGGGTVPPGDGFTIEAVCQNMLPQQVVTRSAIAKDDKEKRINQLYLFFFDENDESILAVYGSVGEYEQCQHSYGRVCRSNARPKNHHLRLGQRDSGSGSRCRR